jgi:hypothetical protein
MKNYHKELGHQYNAPGVKYHEPTKTKSNLKHMLLSICVVIAPVVILGVFELIEKIKVVL